MHMRSKITFIWVLVSCLCTAMVVHGQKSVDPFVIKGFHLDLRIQVIPMPELKNLALQLHQGGINTLIMEWEGSYPFKDEPLIPNRYAYSREEVVSFIGYCKSIDIDVIPLQQSFGHVEYILRHYKYAALREDQQDYSLINPLREELAKQLFTTLYKDLISTHASPYIHIGGDETFLLGHSDESKQKIKSLGMGRLYGDYIKMLCDIVVSLGKRPIVWADIALKYPEALKGLPKQTIFVDWNYGWDIDRFGDHQKLMESGFEIWGSPAIRSQPDNYFLTQWQKHFENIRDFVPTARKLGYKGIVMTSWSTSGSYSPVFESSTDIVNLYAVRRVYPISGFRMLISAYLESIKTAKPLNILSFITNYCKSNYGFTAQQSQVFWQALTKTPFEINQGKLIKTKLTISQLLDSAKSAAYTLHTLKPLNNIDEFEHYRLMADIRVQYLAYMFIEMAANSPGLTEKEMNALRLKLDAINTDELDKQFIELNTGFLYPAELKQENELRGAKIKLLRARLSRSKEN
jgi:hexosaminidase